MNIIVMAAVTILRYCCLISLQSAYHINEDVRQLAEDMLERERGFIERDPHTFKVRLTGQERANCGKQIDARLAEEP
jgi:hypothetical protein